MTIYISQGRYTAAAIRAMTAKPENRSEAIAEMLAAAGGRLIGWYLTLGRDRSTQLSGPVAIAKAPFGGRR